MTNKTYVCGFCGKEHATIEERMNCEKRCFENKARVEAELKKKQREKEEAASKAEITELYARLNEKVREHVKKFGRLHLDNCKSTLTDFPSINTFFDFWR